MLSKGGLACEFSTKKCSFMWKQKAIRLIHRAIQPIRKVMRKEKKKRQCRVVLELQTCS